MRDAITQKILALAKRTETQARDVFDLAHLIGFGEPKLTLDSVSTEDKLLAVNNLVSLSYQDYQSQVLEYIPVNYLEFYTGEEQWLKLVSKLESYIQ